MYRNSRRGNAGEHSPEKSPANGASIGRVKGLGDEPRAKRRVARRVVMNSPVAAPTRPENLPTSVILGTGAYAPLKILTNADLEKIVATNGPWIVSRTGIKERHIAAEGETTSDMAAAAARRALEFAGVDASEIDLIIVATVTGDTPTPSCAAFVQAKIGALNAFAFDVSAACAGSLYGLVIADQFIRNGVARRALVIGAETLSRVVDWTNRETCVLFGDAAGAMLLCASEAPTRGLLAAKLRTDGSMTEILGIFGGGSRRPFSQEMLADNGHKIKMRGREVYKAAARLLPEVVREALEQAGLEAADVTHVIAHQANLRIIESAMDDARRSARKMLDQHRPLRQHLERLDADHAGRGQPGRTLEARRCDRDDGHRRRHELGQRDFALVSAGALFAEFAPGVTDSGTSGVASR